MSHHADPANASEFDYSVCEICGAVLVESSETYCNTCRPVAEAEEAWNAACLNCEGCGTLMTPPEVDEAFAARSSLCVDCRKREAAAGGAS